AFCRSLVSASAPAAALCLFFRYACRPHRHLHSFPTRRSSDLVAVVNKVVAPQVSIFMHYPMYQPAAEIQCQNSNNNRTPNPGVRSEEHTSELQSRENLVCRLLLEKKKINQTPSWLQARHGTRQ